MLLSIFIICSCLLSSFFFLIILVYHHLTFYHSIFSSLHLSFAPLLITKRVMTIKCCSFYFGSTFLSFRITFLFLNRKHGLIPFRSLSTLHELVFRFILSLSSVYLPFPQKRLTHNLFLFPKSTDSKFMLLQVSVSFFGFPTTVKCV